jgi:DNA-binding NarL/FixJ family response regulator
MTISILVADDHDLVRMGIVRMLADVKEYIVAGEAKSGEEAVQFVREHKPNIVLMDVRMPGIGGIEATKKILSANENTHVIAVTSLNDEMFADKLLKAGAQGYVTKEGGFDEITKAIEKVMSGSRYMSADVAQQLALKNFAGDAERSPFEDLSERELQTALMISSGMKVNEIADSFCISPKTVNSYRYRIFEKLDINSDVELALLAVKHGLRELG